MMVYVEFFFVDSITIVLFVFPWTNWPPFRQRHFQKHLFIEKVRFLTITSLKFVPVGPTDNNSALV